MVESHGTGTGLEQLDRRVTRLEETQASLLRSVSRIESMVENLSVGQRGVWDRMNRPWQWGVVVAAVLGLLGLYQAGVQHTTLALEPVRLSVSTVQAQVSDLVTARYDDEQQRKAAHADIHEHLATIREHDAQRDRDIQWLKMLEQRYDNRLHAGQ